MYKNKMTGKHKRSTQEIKRLQSLRKGKAPWNKGLKGVFNKEDNGFYGKKHTSATKEKMRNNHANFSKENHPRWKGGFPKCKLCGKPVSWYRIKYHLECRFKDKRPTSIEVKLYQELKKRKILFEKQKLINGRFVVDAYIPSLNLIIEADGDYWHGLQNNKNKDKAENAYLTKCGFGLIRLKESEINNSNFEKLNILN